MTEDGDEAAERADVFLVSRGFAKSRAEAQAAIRAGRVSADGMAVQKPSQMLEVGQTIAYSPPHDYVSRGGVKLAAALDHFHLMPEGRLCLDLGASTGGFTEVLLRRGAEHVYAVDVGHGQLHGTLKRDARVTSLEGLNARNVNRTHVPRLVNAITADLSFIGLQTGLPAALELAAPGCWLVALVKPQFEVGPLYVGKGGIVRDEEARRRAVSDISEWIESVDGWSGLGRMESPIAGGDGNVEYLLAAAKR